MSTLLVTGGGGFVLCHLVRRWIGLDPANRAIVLDNSPYDDFARQFLADPRILLRVGSVTDRSAWDALPDPGSITHIAHGAAVTSIRRLVDAAGLVGAVDALQVNVMGVAEALAFAARLPGLQRMVTVSSGSVYGPSSFYPDHRPMREDDPARPDGWYALSKHVGEQLTAEAAVQGLPALCVRLSGVFGALDRPTASREVNSVPRQLLHAARDGKSLRLAGLTGGGDYLAAADVANAICALLSCDRLEHTLYNVADGKFTTLGTLAGLVPGLDWQESDVSVADVVADPNQTSGRYGAYDISRLTADTGWQPRPLAATIREYSDWLATHRF